MIKAEGSASPYATDDGDGHGSNKRKRKVRIVGSSSAAFARTRSTSGDVLCAFRGPVAARNVEVGIPRASVAQDACANINGTRKEEQQDVLCITIYEAAKPSELLEMWAMADDSSDDATEEEGGHGDDSNGSTTDVRTATVPVHDPCGTIMWPGSILASREMYSRRLEIVGKTVLVLGAGTGLEAQVAATLGAACVIATDVNQQSLDLLDYGAAKAGLGDIITSRIFDLFGNDSLPLEADVVLAADVTYNAKLSVELGRRMLELIQRKGGRPGVIVVDSQSFGDCDFLPSLEAELVRTNDPMAGQLEWESRFVKDITMSAFLDDEDQTVTKAARVLSF